MKNKKQQLATAFAVTSAAFENVFDKSGEPYILHCLQVMQNVSKWQDNELSIIALLHDLVEDTKWTFSELEPLFSIRIITALKLLTHEKGVPYATYIINMCNNLDAIKVKMGDLEHNSAIFRLKGLKEKDLQRIEKYHKAYITLGNFLIKEDYS